MSDIAQGITRQEAIAEITGRIRQGQALLERPLRDAEELARAEAERAMWTLRNRMVFMQLFSDSSTLAQARPPAEPGAPGFDRAVAAYQQAVREQIGRMLRVVTFLKRLGQGA